MKRFRAIIIVLLLLLPHSFLSAQDYSGTYSTQDEGEIITLNLAIDANGIVTGTMSSEGIDYAIKGQQIEDKITGLMNVFGESQSFTAQFNNDNLILTFMNPEEIEDEYSDPPETLIFRRFEDKKDSNQKKSAESRKSKSQNADSNDKVIINGIVLSESQITELENTYTVKPLPGNYWYDTRSGLYGVTGYPAFGFMLAGHDFGEIGRKVSNGNTGIFVNGRELPQTEWAVWSHILGYWIQPGNYWLDDRGNAGYVGNPIPTENLAIAAQRNSYRGSVAGGDNFWSSRFSAGNYDSGNQRGYVSVPGYGPVGYGF